MSATARATGKAAAKARTAVGEGLGVRGIGEGVEIDDGTPRPSVFDDEAPDLAIDLIALEHEPEPEPNRSPSPKPEPAELPDRAGPRVHRGGGRAARDRGRRRRRAAPGPVEAPARHILKRGSAKGADPRVVPRRAARSSRRARTSTASTRKPDRDDRRPDGHALRARARAGREGEPGDRASATTSRTRWRRPTCASWRRSPGAARSASRCRTSSASSSRSATSSRRREAKQATHPARGRARARHRGAFGDAEPRDAAARADRGRDRRREVELHQLARDVAADALHARAGAAHPRRPEARSSSVRTTTCRIC